MQIQSPLSTIGKMLIAGLLWSLMCFGNTSLWSQAKEIDPDMVSLIDSLTQLTLVDQDDTIRVEALGYLTQLYVKIQIDTVIPICQEGLAIIEAALPQADSTTESALLVQKTSLLNNIGMVYYRLGQKGRATESWFEVLTLREALGQRRKLPNTYNNIGQAFIDLENLDRAEEYFEKSLAISEEFNDSLGIARSYNNFGYLSKLKGDLPGALSSYRKGLAMRKALSDSIGIAVGLNNVGFVHLKQAAYDSAQIYLEECLAIWEKRGTKDDIANSCNLLGATHTGKRNFPQAKAYLERGETLAHEESGLATQYENAKFFSQYHQATGDDAQALTTYQTYIALRDSALDLGRQQELIQNELEYNFTRKEAVREVERDQERALQASRNSQQWLLIGLIGIGLLLALVFLWVLRRRLVTIEAQKTIIEKQRQQIEMEALRAQMNPHFIFNSLNSIKFFVIRNDTREAVAYLNKFSRLVRLTLENSKENLIPLAVELEGLEHYLALERLRYDQKFDYKIEDEVSDLQVEIPPLVLQPYVENAIWHGIMPLETGGLIQVRTRSTEGRVCIEIEDNGIGRKAAAQNSQGMGDKQSMGMALSADRLRLLEFVHGQQPAVEVIDLFHPDGEARGTLVRITLNQSL